MSPLAGKAASNCTMFFRCRSSAYREVASHPAHDVERGNRAIFRPLGYAICLIILATAALALGPRGFVMPHVSRAKDYPAHDAHLEEDVTIGVDPYDDAQKCLIFRARYLEHGLLPMLFMVSNDSTGSLALSEMNIQLVLRNRSKISPATEDDLYRRLSQTPQQDSPVSRLPIPRTPKAGVSKDIKEEMAAARFSATMVEPGATRSGFYFFDVSGMESPVPGAHLYVTGIRENSKELLFFDLPLDKYLETKLSHRRSAAGE